MITVTSPPTSEPTREQIHAEYVARLENGFDTASENDVARWIWAAYLVTAMRNARTHAELLDLLRKAVLGGYGGTHDSFTSLTPREAYNEADERLANTFWTDGRVIFKFWGGRLASHLNDGRLSIDLEQSGFIALERNELRRWQVNFIERKGKCDNTEGWLADLVAAYHEDAARYIPANQFVCVVCKHSTVLKDYGDEYRATCAVGWPLDTDTDPVTCPRLEEPEKGTWV